MNTKLLHRLNDLLIRYGNAQFDCGVYCGVYGLEEPKPSSVEYKKSYTKTCRLKKEIIGLFKLAVYSFSDVPKEEY